MKKSIHHKIVISIFLSFCAFGSLAQNILKGKVGDTSGQPLAGVKVSVEGSSEVTTKPDGTFEVSLSQKVNNPQNVKATKKGFEMVDFAMSRKTGSLQIIMDAVPLRLNGMVLNLKDNPISDVTVKLGGPQYPDIVKTNGSGEFFLELPPRTRITSTSRFLVNGTVVSGNYMTYNSDSEFIILKIDLPSEADNNADAATNSTLTEEESTNSDSDLVQEDNTLESKIEEDDNEVPSTLIVVVYDEDISPAESIQVYVDRKEFLTDSLGEFEIKVDSLNNSDFDIPNYEITKRFYDYEDNYMFIHIQDPNSKSILDQNLDSIEITYDENFDIVFDQLESEKQLLQENGTELRKEITKISSKLEKDRLDSNQRDRLQAYLMRLEESLIENEVAYETAQFKTREMLEKMRGDILESLDTIETIEEKAKIIQLELILSIIIAVISIILMLNFFISQRKIRKQHDELEEAHHELKDAKEEIEHSHNEMNIVRDVGQEFTAKLDLGQHMIELQHKVSELFELDIFEVGVYNPMTKDLEFHTVKGGKDQSEHVDSLYEKEKLSVWSFEHHKKVIINDVEKEIVNFIPQGFAMSEDTPRSIIYLPLIVEEETIGVLGFLSYHKDAYQDVNSSVLTTLGSYASIAVSNSNAFGVIKQKNRNITDSIRYAETIQKAILPSQGKINAELKDSFIIYRSKDIVSGDFYWSSNIPLPSGSIATFIAVIDCTGHGVPGAFMSMIGNTLLNEIINQKKITNTKEILDNLDIGVKAALQQEQNTHSDGMDVCLCCFERLPNGKTKIQFTGAKRPLFYIGGEFTKIQAVQGDTKSIASLYHTKREFTAKELVLEEGHKVYLTTDGYIDQHNKERERFGTVRLKKLLAEIHDKPMAEQQEILESTLDNHQGDEEQRDDITIIGVQL